MHWSLTYGSPLLWVLVSFASLALTLHSYGIANRDRGYAEGAGLAEDDPRMIMAAQNVRDRTLRAIILSIFILIGVTALIQPPPAIARLAVTLGICAAAGLLGFKSFAEDRDRLRVRRI